MPRILKNIRIDEVSAVTAGAGEGTRIVLMKRDTSGDDFDEWRRQQARIAEEQNELHLRKHARNWRSFDEVLAERTAKSAEGDEAEGLIAEPPPVDDAIADAADRRRDDGIVFDIGDTRLEFPNERALAVWLAVQERIRKSNQEESTAMKTTEELEAERTAKSVEGDEAEGLKADPHPVDDVITDAADRRHDDGIVFDIGDTRLEFPNERALAVWLAVQERIRKSNRKENTMTTPEQLQELREVVKASGLTAVVKRIIDAGSSYAISDLELVELISHHAPQSGESPAQTFTRHYCEQSEQGALIRKAIAIAKEEASLDPIVVEGNVNDPDDAAEATAALNRLVDEQRARAPWMSAEQVFDTVMAKNSELTNRAIRRPAPTTTYPMPK